jgi:pyruvate/2-oxoglutarate dehydrogenase complex dihydrolipoamide acyltransferase (E2) component
MDDSVDTYAVREFPRIRQAYIDVLEQGRRRHLIHGLVEADVTTARRVLRARAAEGRPLSFTAFVVACVAAAVAEQPMLHAYRSGRRRLVLFDDVDVNTEVEETRADGTRIVASRIIRGANRKTVEEISAEIRDTQAGGDVDRRRYQRTLWYLALPRAVRMLGWRVVMGRPLWFKRFGGTVAVSAIGMFAAGGGWGVPLTPTTLMATVGGIAERPVVIDGDVETREYLSLTITVDHDIVDGAPAARYAARLCELVEQAAGLVEPADHRHGPSQTAAQRSASP